MGGFLGIGNSSAKTDRGNQLSGINASWDVFNQGLPLAGAQENAGTSTTAQGLTGLDAAQKYWKSIMSGGPAAMKAAAPAVNATNEQADAAKNQEAQMGTSRGGGTGAGNQELEFNKMGDINKELFNVAPAAAQQETTASTAETNVGNQQLGHALQALGLSQETSNEIIDSSIKSRPISQAANAEVRQQWSNFLGALGL